MVWAVVKADPRGDKWTEDLLKRPPGRIKGNVDICLRHSSSEILFSFRPLSLSILCFQGEGGRGEGGKGGGI